MRSYRNLYDTHLRKLAVNIQHTSRTLKEMGVELLTDMLRHSRRAWEKSKDGAAQAGLLRRATLWPSLMTTINLAYNFNNSSLPQRAICPLDRKSCTMRFCVRRRTVTERADTWRIITLTVMASSKRGKCLWNKRLFPSATLKLQAKRFKWIRERRKIKTASAQHALKVSWHLDELQDLTHS